MLRASNIASGTPAAVTTMAINGAAGANYSPGALTARPRTSPGLARLLGALQQTQPSVDAIEEVSIETSNFAAEYGTAGGAMINMISKSGTNDYHGSAYDYGTNEALNAHQPYTGIRNVVKQHDWGFTIGAVRYGSPRFTTAETKRSSSGAMSSTGTRTSTSATIQLCRFQPTGLAISAT